MDAARRLIVGQIQAQCELAPLAGTLATRVELAAMHIGEPAGEREPDAKTALAASARAIAAAEHFEHARQRVGRYAGAVVAHSDRSTLLS